MKLIYNFDPTQQQQQQQQQHLIKQQCNLSINDIYIGVCTKSINRMPKLFIK